MEGLAVLLFEGKTTERVESFCVNSKACVKMGSSVSEWFPGTHLPHSTKAVCCYRGYLISI